jgi:hypothetical protein
MKRLSLRRAAAVLLLSLGPLTSLAHAEAPAARLGRWLSGAFSSARQAAEDPRYYDVRIHVAPIWPERTDGPWLYVEQALAATLARPYRQRILRLVAREDGAFESQVYRFPRQEDFVGAWEEPERFADLATGDLLLRQGCGVFLEADGPDTFAGATRGEGCASSINGATYATSEARVSATEMTSWDRGYDAEGRQVWGAVAGPYRFDRTPFVGEKVAQVGSFILGTSDNAEQAARAPSDFVPVDYEICPVEIEGGELPPGAEASMVRQAITRAPGLPPFVRERIYAFYPRPDGDVGFQSWDYLEGATVPALCPRPDAERTTLDGNLIDWASGCEMQFRGVDDATFTGETLEEGCPSSYQGAEVLRIQAVIRDGAFDIWERWYDADGAQVAGSSAGPYEYRRRSDPR